MKKKKKSTQWLYYAKYQQRTTEDRIKIKRWLVDYLGGKCIDCGYSAHLAALDFDHVDPTTKRFTISGKMNQYNLTNLLLEAKKCVLRCANCHRIRTNPNATDTKESK